MEFFDLKGNESIRLTRLSPCYIVLCTPEKSSCARNLLFLLILTGFCVVGPANENHKRNARFYKTHDSRKQNNFP